MSFQLIMGRRRPPSTMCTQYSIGVCTWSDFSCVHGRINNAGRMENTALSFFYSLMHTITYIWSILFSTVLKWKTFTFKYTTYNTILWSNVDKSDCFLIIITNFTSHQPHAVQIDITLNSLNQFRLGFWTDRTRINH